MVNIRTATVDDLLQVQTDNLWSLPENYQMKYYFYHLLTWPQLTFVAEDDDGKIVGYVLGKLDEEQKVPHGHITSISVRRTHRRMGIAYMLMCATHKAMVEVYGAQYASLQVRKSNKAAFRLYKDIFKYEIEHVEEKYYADGEDGLLMKKKLDPEIVNSVYSTNETDPRYKTAP